MAMASSGNTSLTSSSQRLMQEIYDQFLICKICYGTYNKPKTLTCLHIFCTECLEKHLEAEVERSYRYMLYCRTITCPVCRKKTDIPSGGVRRLPDNFLVANLIEIVSRRRGSGRVPQCEICKPTSTAATAAASGAVVSASAGYHAAKKEAAAKCLECGKLLCSDCIDLHRRTKVTRGHNLIDTTVEKSIGCKVHADEVVRFYCEPCELCICVLCTFQEHKGHNVQSFSEGIQKYQNSLDALVTSCKDRIACVKEHLDLIKACESEIRKAEDQIRDATIESISAIRQSEKKQVEELYEVFGEDTIQFLKEKHVLQDVLDNLMSSCSLTEIILKDKSIELLLLRREIQDKLEVLLQDRIQTPPQNLTRQVTFEAGQVVFGQLLVDGEESRRERQVVSLRANSSDSGVQTNLDWGSGTLQTDDDKLGRRLEMTDIPINTNPPDSQSTPTVTDIVSIERTSVQTELMPISERRINTQNVDFWSQFTNTPRVQSVDRSTLTTKTSMTDSHTETKGLVDIRNTICGPDLPPSQNMGTLTDPPDMRSRATSTTAVQLADKKVATAKLISHDIGIDPVKISTHDFGVMTKTPPGVDKAIGTKTVVVSDMCTGGGNTIIRTADANTDTIWKGIRRVRHKATMHELLYCTQETDTDNLIRTEDRASSPCPIITDDDTAENMPSVKRKYSSAIPTVALDAKRACTSETQTDLNLQSQIFKNLDPRSLLQDLQGTKPKITLTDRGTTMASCVRVTDIGTGTVHVRIIDPGVNTTPTETNTAKVKLLDSGSVQRTFMDKGVDTGRPSVRNKETSTSVTKMKEKGTETYVQSVEKATYMIQPVILSTGTNTPMVFTSDKKSETDFDDWNLSQPESVGAAGVNNNYPAAATINNDNNYAGPALRPTTDALRQGQITMTPVIPGQSGTIERERDMTGVQNNTTKLQLQDATTSTNTPETSDKETDYDRIQTSNTATMTFVLMSDIGVQKRPHTLSRATSMKKIKTAGSEESLGSPVQEIPPISSQGKKAEKTTATFKVELKSTGVCTPVVKLEDRESSPIAIGIAEKSTSMTGVNVTYDIAKDKVPQLVKATTKDRACSPHRTLPYEANAQSVVEKREMGCSTIDTAPHTRDYGIGTAHVTFFEKETCTPRITTMHKNMATENIKTADKQTATTDVAAAYKGLFRQHSQNAITVSRGTCTTPAKTTDRECSPIKDVVNSYLVDTGTNPVRKIYINKAVGVTKADLTCPQDKFHRAGQGARPRVLPKNIEMVQEEEDPKYAPMATIQEGSSDEETVSGNSSPQLRMNNRIRMFAQQSSQGTSTTHRERLWRTPQRLGNNNGAGKGSYGRSLGLGGIGEESTGCNGTDGSHCSSTSSAGSQCSSTGSNCSAGSQCSEQSTFSQTGSTQTSSIRCQVETGTSTPPVETEDKAMCTESVSVDAKINQCISKLRNVSQRLEAQTTSITLVEGAAAASGPIYSKAESYKRASVTTQSTCPPILSGQMLCTQRRGDGAIDEMGAEREGLAPLPGLGSPARKPSGLGRRPLGGLTRLGSDPLESAASPPFLQRRELHSIDTGMASSNGPSSILNNFSSSFDSSSLMGGRSSKARKQRLDITQLLHRPPGSGGGGATADGVAALPGSVQVSSLRGSGAPYRPSLKIGSLDECSRNFHTDPVVKRLRAKMSALDSPEDEHPPSAFPSPKTSNRDSPTENSTQQDPLSLLNQKPQRSDRPKLENMLGSVSSSSSVSSPSSSPKTDQKLRNQQKPNGGGPKITKPSPPPVRKSGSTSSSKDRTSSKSRSPPINKRSISERRESNSSTDTKSGSSVCCGLGSPRTVHKNSQNSSSSCSSVRSPRKTLKEIGRLQRAHATSFSTSSSSSSNDDGRDSPADSTITTSGSTAGGVHHHLPHHNGHNSRRKGNKKNM